jgi:hypothetical protein
MRTNIVTFFITTARSGTQWICETLRENYPDLLVVGHEPIRYAYAPKRYLRNPDAAWELRQNPKVSKHLDNIHRTLESKSYVEVGFPAFAAAPLLWGEFGERLLLVQLSRHPVRVAASLVTHRWFDPGQRPDVETDIIITPTDPGARMKHYADRWDQMSAFEKALFFWAEVHSFGVEVQTTFEKVPFCVVTFEGLLARPEEREYLARFLGLPYRQDWSQATKRNIDSFRTQTTTSIDRQQIYQIPEVVELAEQFGYDVAAVSTEEIQRRYRISWISKVQRRVKRSVHRAAALWAWIAAVLHPG